MSILSGLESLGLGKLSGMEVYSETKENSKPEEKKHEEQKINEADLLFDKAYKCPVCDKEFTNKTIKTGKAKLIGTDMDLRPKYQGVDPLKYDAVVCPLCGYAALTRFFNTIVNAQAKLVRDNISHAFTGLDEKIGPYTYDEAIVRYKLVLANAIVKKGKLGERAYICLKTAWLLRGKREGMPESMPEREKAAAILQNEEKELLYKAQEGFTVAFTKETFPICGMDEVTMTYLISDLLYESGKYDESARWISRLLVSKSANDRIKNRARELRDLIVEAKKG